MSDPVADIVADVVATTRRGTAVYGLNRFHAPWGVRVPPGRLAGFHVVTSGACWLVPDGGEPIRLARGDAVLVLADVGHVLADTPGRPTRSMEELIGGPLGESSHWLVPDRSAKIPSSIPVACPTSMR
ncbi:cupin domain-containing protein [Actinomadura sp. SCN-SB]|uniref:cupin domain-containing protein n=1 Tax=Actinomadura sp. SCN-SB TaxID=3373092 RepID=UPI0037503502